MAYIGANPVNGFFEKQDLTTDGRTTTFTLNTAVGSSSAILVSVGGVIQEPEVAYNLGVVVQLSYLQKHLQVQQTHMFIF